MAHSFEARASLGRNFYGKAATMGNLTKLDDERVNRFIEWSTSEAKRILAQQGNTSPSTVDINYVGWQLLKTEIRGDTAHKYDDDYDAAAAEHYMYIRFLAGHTGDQACHTAPTLYAAKKVFDQAVGRLQSGQAQGGHPVLPANPYIVAWGQRGVVAGLADYKTVSKGADYKLGNAVGALAEFSVPKETAQSLGNYAVKAGNAVPGDYKK